MIRGNVGRKALLLSLQFAALLALVTLIAAQPSGNSARAAETKTWNGSVNGQWSEDDNWTPSGAPVATDTLVFPSGAENQTNVNDLPGNTAFAAIEVTGGTYQISGNDLDITDGLEITDGVATFTLDIGGAGDVLVTDGNLTLAGSNTYTGTTTVADGRLIVLSDEALGATAGSTLLTGGILEIRDNIATAEPIVAQDSESEIAATGNATLSGAITLEAAIAFESQAGNLQVTGVVSGGGGIIKVGAGNLTLSAVNTFTGAVTIESGPLTLTSTGTLGTGAGATAVLAGGALVLQANATIEGEDVTIAGTGVSNGGAIRVTGAGATADTITLAANASVFVDTDATFEIETGIETANPAFVLTKSGPGTLILSDAATIEADITLAAGTLVADSESDTDLLVTGGTLSGFGAFGEITFEGGRLLPGNAGEGRIEATTVTADEGVTFSFLVEQAGGGSLWVDGTGATVDPNGATLEILGDGDITPGTTFVLLRQPGAAITGEFEDLPDGAIFADAEGRFWQIDYTTGTENTISIVALAALEADLSVELESESTVPQDTTDFELDVVVTNDADAAMAGVKVNITLPNGVEFVSGPAGCVGPDEEDEANLVVCTIASLPTGETTLTLILEVTAPSGSSLLFHAAIDWPGDDPDDTNNTDTHTVTVTDPDEFPFRYYLPHIASDGPIS